MSLGKWADYSGGRPSGATLKADGYVGVIRYVGLGSAGKRITAAEYQDLVRNGIQVLLVAELNTDDAWVAADDYAAGVSHANTARADARTCGIPDSVPILAAADSHATAGQVADAVKYARGFNDALGHTESGTYGFLETLTGAHNAGVGSYFWLAGSQPSAANQQWIHLWQRNDGTAPVAGVQVDISEQYLPIGAPDMLLTDNVHMPNWAGVDTPATVKTVNNCLAEDNIRIQQIAAAVVGLTAALAAATANPAITPQMVTDAINAAVAAHVKVTIAVTPTA
ncbi:MAG: hypothetical protein JWQ81_1664 [Amycolatopsis sp.]|jgi:hypothetical protein|uniref:glycoside hydrolase domain-containing protein n=1 Tax=Amycolatopsis sp. TaxID=37632 RepID=UPI002635B5E1|nr:glycoside hydrolase domain-containing protein [Amycolatopsis sp.]MCU1680925.1 hypothetical protein [Amycolatopsis sp.]